MKGSNVPALFLVEFVTHVPRELLKLSLSGTRLGVLTIDDKAP
jgi:hypothetical protein